MRHGISGGADRGRTDDLMNAIHALYQLSYGPSAVGIASTAPPEGQPKISGVFNLSGHVTSLRGEADSAQVSEGPGVRAGADSTQRCSTRLVGWRDRCGRP